ncbi:toxin-antitoxin system, toxin component domain protein [Ostertagia ostertagi]
MAKDRSAGSPFAASDLDLDDDANLLKQKLGQAIRVRLALLSAGFHPKMAINRFSGGIDSNVN